MLNDSWFVIKEIDSMTFALCEQGHLEKVYSFLLIGNSEAILIDTGQGIGKIKKVTDQLTDLPIRVLTTNAHYDHIGGHGEFEQTYIHKDDADFLVNGFEGITVEAIREEINRDLIKCTPDSFDLNTYTPYRGKPTGYLTDGEVINLGNRVLEIYHTPGHTPGHICIFDQTNGYLFTGSILYDQAPIFAFYPSASPKDLISSLKRICALDGVSMVYGSHNTLGLNPKVLDETKEAIEYLEEKKQVYFGSGLHAFETVSFLF